MKEDKQRNILELIGVILIIVAVISSYGLYYTADKYAMVTEAQLSTEASISDVTAYRVGDDIRLDITGTVSNPSRMDIDVSVIEVRLYLSDGSYNQLIGLATGAGESIASGDSAGFLVSYTYDESIFQKYLSPEDSFLLVYEGEANFQVEDATDTTYEAEIPFNGMVVTVDG